MCGPLHLQDVNWRLLWLQTRFVILPLVKSGIKCSIILFQDESESLNSNKWNLQCDFTKN